ncbi:hypothetical protein LR48_Vigan03g030800 [Vigna angularis]|uniref:Uncharacterized protein n=1 Tax=Phaseolus angularis TaxID=3914 RepID=A0A0L9U2M1_PHAAN|nr:hypothetical protein LR48_Vigan03g030800 [Vigna angularis]
MGSEIIAAISVRGVFGAAFGGVKELLQIWEKRRGGAILELERKSNSLEVIQGSLQEFSGFWKTSCDSAEFCRNARSSKTGVRPRSEFSSVVLSVRPNERSSRASKWYVYPYTQSIIHTQVEKNNVSEPSLSQYGVVRGRTRAEAGGHVTPEHGDEGGEGRRCKKHGAGSTDKERLLAASGGRGTWMNRTYTGMRGIWRLCRTILPCPPDKF